MANKWWGYLHTAGTIQVKVFFDERDIDDAYESPFVQKVVKPFNASSREEAIEYIRQQLDRPCV
jgi:hypothetical protein